MNNKTITLKDGEILITYPNLSKDRSAVRHELMSVDVDFSYTATNDGRLISYAPFTHETAIAASILEQQGFVVESSELKSITSEIREIFNNRHLYTPKVDLVDGKWVLSNASPQLTEYFNQLLDSGMSDYGLLLRMKLAGVSFKTHLGSSLTNSVLSEKANHFKIPNNPASYVTVLKTINDLAAYPLLVVLQESNEDFKTVFDNIFKELIKTIDIDDMAITISPSSRSTSEFIKTTGISKNINESTKVVFIGSNNIPASYIKSNWHPFAVMFTSSHNFGSVGELVETYPVVFYLNTLIRSHL